MSIPERHTVAILIREAGGGYHFETRTINVPEIGPNDLLVRLSVSGVCGSDFHLAAGHSGPTRDILGHEGVGRVAKLGAAVPSSFVDIGSRVGVAWVRDVCEKCACCLMPGGETRCLEKICSGLKRDGTFAEYAVVPARYLIRIPEGVPDELVAPILCGGVTAYKAIKVGEAVPGQWVVISGAGGGVGALGVQFARAMGYRVLAIDVGDSKKEYCLRLGAEVYIDATQVDVRAVEALTGGGAAAVLVMANSAKAYQAALELVAPFGSMVCVGIPPPDQLVSFHPTLGISKNVRIIGSAVGTRKDIWEAIDFVRRGVVKPSVQMARLEDLTQIAKDFGKVSGKYVIRLCDDPGPVSR